MNRPEAHDVLRRWRTIADRYDPRRVLLGETWVLDLESLARFYGSGEDELHLAPTCRSSSRPRSGDAGDRRTDRGDAPTGAWPLWNGSNHDAGRFATRWCDGDERRARAALGILLTLRGTPLLYYGDEIGMPNVDVPRDRLMDPVGRRHWPEDLAGTREDADAVDARGGFSDGGVEPWLPMGDARSRNVADRRDDPASFLSFCRDLIGVRRDREDLRSGSYEALGSPEGVWAWRRGPGRW